MGKCPHCHLKNGVHKLSCPTKKMVIPAHMIFQEGTEYIVTGTEKGLKAVGIGDMRIIGEIVVGVKTYPTGYVNVLRQNPDHKKLMPDHREDLDIPRHMLTRVKNTYDINEGDEIIVLYTDGVNPNGTYTRGKLTKKWDEEPYCEIDNKPIDLAGEGHSSKMYKVIYD